MGNNPFCDFCRKPTRVETALQDVLVGDEKVGEACLTCASSVKTNLGKVISDAAMVMEKAQHETNAAQTAQQEQERLAAAQAPPEAAAPAPAPAAPAPAAPAPGAVPPEVPKDPGAV